MRQAYDYRQDQEVQERVDFPDTPPRPEHLVLMADLI